MSDIITPAEQVKAGAVGRAVDDIERTRAKWLEVAQSAPDEETRAKAVVKLRRLAQDYPTEAGIPGEARDASKAYGADIPVGDFEEPGLIRRGMSNIGTAAPSVKRQLERGISDSATLGLAEKIAKKVLPAVGYDMSDYSDEQAAKDQSESSMARTVGSIGGALLPGGATSRIGRGVLKVAGKLTGRVPGMLSGAAGGLAATPITAGLVAGGQQAVNAGGADDLMSIATGIADVPKRAYEAARDTATNPLAMGLGGLAGAAGGAGARIRGSNTQTGRDLRAVEGAGAKPSLTAGAKGGAFDEAPFAGRNPRDFDSGELAREAGDTVRGGLRQRYQEAQGQYGADKAAAMESGALGTKVDITQQVQDMLGIAEDASIPSGVRNGVLAKIQSEFLDDPVVKRMWTADGKLQPTVEELNYLRQRWDQIAKTGDPGEIDVLRNVAERLRAVEDTTPIADVKGPYAEEMGALRRAHNQLGLGPRVSTGPDDQAAAGRVAINLARRGQNTSTAGIREKPIEEFIAENPQYANMVNAVPLMQAAGRLKAKLGVPESGGLMGRLGGLATQNLEPFLGGVVYPASKAAPGALIPPGSQLPTAEAIMQMLLDQQQQRKRQ